MVSKVLTAEFGFTEGWPSVSQVNMCLGFLSLADRLTSVCIFSGGGVTCVSSRPFSVSVGSGKKSSSGGLCSSLAVTVTGSGKYSFSPQLSSLEDP